MRSTTILGLQATRLVSQAIRIFPRAHVRGKGGGGREGMNLPRACARGKIRMALRDYYKAASSATRA